MAVKPNVILIMTDDQKFSSLGFGGGNVLTPKIDSLVKGGVVFTNAFVSSTVCSPARYTTLTGRYAGRNYSPNFIAHSPLDSMSRICIEDIDMEKDGMNLQSVMHSNGYATGIVGKWHLGPHIGYPTYGPTWSEFGLSSYAQTADPKTNATANSAMKLNHGLYAAAIRAYGWDYAASLYVANLAELKNDYLNVHNIDWTAKGALDFIEQNKAKPFFLYFATTLNHGPDPWNLNASKQLYTSVDADPRISGEGYLDSAPGVLPSRANVKARVAAASKAANTAYCTWLDDAVGALVKKVRDLGLDSNTIFIYMTDQGFERYGKATLFEGGIRIPLAMTWKGTITPAKTCAALVQNIDITPTILDLCGVSLPKSYLIDGTSMVPLLPGKRGGSVSGAIHQSLFFEIGYARAVRTLTSKYIAVRYPADVQAKINAGIKFDGYYAPDIGVDERGTLTYPYLLNNPHLGHFSSASNPNYFDRDQLYAIATDPAESSNLLYDTAGNPLPNSQISAANQQKRAEMQALLTSYLNTFPRRPYGELSDGKTSVYKEDLPAMQSPGVSIIAGQPGQQARIISLSGRTVATVPLSVRGETYTVRSIMRHGPRSGVFFLRIESPGAGPQSCLINAACTR
jgi:arylsulfatase A-like enzyme